MVGGQVRGVEKDDALALVAGFGEECLGAGDVDRLEAAGSGSGFEGGAAEEPGRAVVDLLGGADADAVEVLALVDEVEKRLAGAGIVEGGLGVVDAEPEIEADGG